MQGNDRLNEIAFMIRGSKLPSNEEIMEMSLEEKQKLENEQEQIIQIFRQQALLDIWEFKIKISHLIEEAIELRAQIVQKQKVSNNINLVINKEQDLHKNNNETQEQKTSANQRKKSPARYIHRKKNKDKKGSKQEENSPKQEKTENKNEIVELNPKKLTIRINSKIIANPDKPKHRNSIEKNEIDQNKYSPQNRKTKVRNLVKKKSKLDTSFLRRSDVKNNQSKQQTHKKQTEQNNQPVQPTQSRIPKYPFSVQSTEIPKKTTNLVSTLNPKVLLDPKNPLNMSNKNKKSNLNTDSNLNTKNKNSNILSSSCQKAKNKTNGTNKNNINTNKSKIVSKDSIDKKEFNSIETKPRPVPKQPNIITKQTRREAAGLKATSEKKKKLSMK